MAKHVNAHLFGTLNKAIFGETAPQIPTEKQLESRRSFIKNAGLSMASLAFMSSIGRFAKPPTVAIIGGGLAGLTALHTFKKAGLSAQLYEASNRLGGRVMTSNNLVGEATWTELGGEFIDSNHKEILDLAQELNLRLLDTQGDKNLVDLLVRINNKDYSQQQIMAAFQDAAPIIRKDIDSIPKEISAANPGTALLLDNVSIVEYLKGLHVDKNIAKMLEVAYESEYGMLATEQSCINMLTMLKPETATMFTDERYKVKGGNGQISDVLSSNYGNQINTGYPLKAVTKRRDSYELNFEGSSKSVKADFVIITIPFTKLREVEFVNMELPPLKQKAINELGYGNNAKLVLGFKQHVWEHKGFEGNILSDNGVQYGWDNTKLQNKRDAMAGYTIFAGGTAAKRLSESTPKFHADRLLPKLNDIMAGTQDMHNGKVTRMCWQDFQWAQGSYSGYKVGQWTSLRGAEQMPIGNVFFAGEHCSADYQGFMNGAVQTGRQAAENILKKMAK
jgi:monoamine oxidase